METKPELIIIGYTNIDINITPSTKTILPGGAAYFVALAASLVTKPIGLVTRIGKDFNPTFLLSRVLPDGIHIIEDKQTAKSTQIYESDTDLTKRDIKLDWGVAPDICTGDIPGEWLQSAKYIHVGTMPPKQQAPFLPYLKKNAPQAKISIDTDQYLLSNEDNKKLVATNFSQADIIFVNRIEYNALKTSVDTHPFAVFKRDRDGASILTKGKEIAFKKAPPRNSIDVTGAGDILAGTFIANLTIGKNEKESLEAAVNQATESIAQEGIMHLFN